MHQTARRTVNVASRIAAGDDRTSYDLVARALHWLTVFLVLANFLLAETWDRFGRPTHHLMVTVHMSFGILLAAAVAARIVWRLIPGHQMPPATSGVQELAAKAVHWLLYVLLAAEAVLGFVLRWSGGESMVFFGLPIPSPMAKVSHPTHGFIGDLHHWNGWLIITLAVGHAGAALYHHFVLKDQVLRRMWPSAPR